MAERRAKGEGSLFRTSQGRWVARVEYLDPGTGRMRRTQASGKTKSEAARKLRVMRARVHDGQPARDDQQAFGRYAESWVTTTLQASDRKATTKALYAGLARTHLIGGALAAVPLAQLRPSHVEQLVLTLRRTGYADSTVRQIYTVLRAIGDAAVRDNFLARNPVAAVKRPAVTRDVEATSMSPAQVSALLSAAEGSRYHPLLVLLASTGLRRGEALALCWSDVDLDEGLLRVRGTLARVDGRLTVTLPKTRRSKRTVALSGVVADALRQVKVRTAEERLRAGSAWRSTGFVFVTEAGQPVDPRNALRALSAAARKAGLPGVGLHTLRHTAASTMLSNGVPLTTVSRLLGHSSVAITGDVYGHVAPDVSRAAVNVLAVALAMDQDQSHRVTDKVDAGGRET